MQERRRSPRHSHAAAREDPQEPHRRPLADRPRRHRHLLRQAGRGGGVRRRRVHRHPRCPTRSARSTRHACWRCSNAPTCRSSSIISGWRAAGPRRLPPPAAPWTCWSRWTSASIAAASRPTRGPRWTSSPRCRRCRDCGCTGCSSHAGHAYHAPRADALRAIADDGGAHPAHAGRSGAGPRHRHRGTQRRRHADGALLARAGRPHGVSGRQLRLLRSHAGRAGRGDTGRLRADRPGHRRLHAGRGSPHPRLRQQNAGRRRRTRLFAAARTRRRLPRSGHGARLAARRRLDYRAPLGGTCHRARGRRTDPLEPGNRVRVVPNHSCVVSNLVDQAWVTDGESVLEPLAIAARGRIT